MHDLPLISVVMPAYNAEKFISESIESILNQSYPNLELLICDDASTDRTREIIQRYSAKDKRIKFFQNLNNQGYLKTCNKLFNLTIGEYITTQDSDDLSDPQRLAKQLELIQNNSVDCCFVLHVNIDESGKTLDNFKELPSENEEIKKRLETDFPWLPNPLLIKRTVYNEIGGYNEYFDRICAEDHYWVGLMAAKFNFGCINEPLYFWRKHHSSVTHTTDRLEKFYTADLARVLYLQKRYLNRCDSLESCDMREINYIENSFKRLYIKVPNLLIYRYLFKYFKKGRFTELIRFYKKNRTKLSIKEFINVIGFYIKKRFFYNRYFNLNVKNNEIFKKTRTDSFVKP